jgi:glycosyltransferase involved in cell wall biosynthesis
MGIHTVSVVIPLFNNEETIEECYRAVSATLSAHQGTHYTDYEIVFVDDGSRDRSLNRLLDLLKSDPHARVLELDHNYGQHAAISAGFEAAEGDVIVTLDADLQINPEEIRLLLEKIEEGHELVSGVRIGRKDSLLKRTLPSRLFNRLVGRITGVRLRDWGCPTVALRRSLAKQMLRYGEMRRFLKPLGVRLARSVAEVDLRHYPRTRGRSAYGIQDLFELALDFVTNFSRRPFQKVSLGGTVLLGIGMLLGIAYLVIRFLFGVHLGARMQALVFLALVVGLQLMVLGFLGEFIIRIYRRQNNLPFYTVKAVHRGKDT